MQTRLFEGKLYKNHFFPSSAPVGMEDTGDLFQQLGMASALGAPIQGIGQNVMSSKMHQLQIDIVSLMTIALLC